LFNGEIAGIFSMLICPTCQFENPHDHKFCQSCGTPLNLGSVNSQSSLGESPTLLQDDGEQNPLLSDTAPTSLLSKHLKTVEYVAGTNVGRQRQKNEDYFGITSEQQKVELPHGQYLQVRGLYIVCDGMGGHAGGEVASELAVNTIKQYFDQHWVEGELPTLEMIRQSILVTNQAIYDINQEASRSGIGRMGTTLVMLIMSNNKLAVSHVGDSRIYSVTITKGLEQITVDHEVAQREISKGVDAKIAYSRPDAYQLTQALGPRDGVYPDISFLEVCEDTLFLLVSDGLSDNDLLENHWQTHLLPLLVSNGNLESGLSNLIDLANEYNGHDNITAILILVRVFPR
jgi:protein phosphatase